MNLFKYRLSELFTDHNIYKNFQGIEENFEIENHFGDIFHLCIDLMEVKLSNFLEFFEKEKIMVDCSFIVTKSELIKCLFIYLFYKRFYNDRRVL